MELLENDILLEDLVKSYNLSARSYNVCEKFDLTTYNKILSHYKEHYTFLNLRTCGDRSNQELIKLCHSLKEQIKVPHNFYENFFGNLNAAKRIKINNFINEKYESLSIRSKNGLRYHLDNNLCITNFIKEIFANNNFNTERLRNIGAKSVIELNEFILNIKSYMFQLNEDILVNQNENLHELKENIIDKVDNLNRAQKQLLYSFIKLNFNILSVRSQNGINSYVSGILNIKTLVTLFSKSFDEISKIKNVGVKSAPEIFKYISDIKNYTEQICDITDEEQLEFLNKQYQIQNTFNLDNTPNEILQSQYIFNLTEYLLSNNAFFKEDKTIIIRNSMNIYQNKDYKTLEEIGKEVGLTRERVRQVREKYFLEIKNNLLFLINFEDDLLQNYGIDVSKDFIILSDEIVDLINELNKTDFTKQFIIFILSVYLKNEFEIVGNEEDALIPKYFSARGRHKWKNIFLVKKEIKSSLNFEVFVDDIYSRINDKIEETYEFDFKSYLSNFLKVEDYLLLNEIYPFAEHIIEEEFNLYLDLEDNIVFKRNKLKQVYEYTYEALEKLGKPSKVNVIYNKVVELYPHLDTEENRIRSSMKRANGFIPFGRTSVFGLKKWETQMGNIKGGTIRSITRDLLISVDTPHHIMTITSHVLKFRPNSNQSSILSNLKLDKSDIFIFFKNSYVGLVSKKYDIFFKKIEGVDKPQKESWENRYESLLKFIENNNRLPKTDQYSNKDERALNSWLRIQRGKIKKGVLEENKIILIKNIFSSYSNVNEFTHRIKRKDKYQKLQEFIIVNKRLPRKGNDEEQMLYEFLNKQIKLFKRDNLEGKYLVIIKNIMDEYYLPNVKIHINNKEEIEINANYSNLLEYVKDYNSLPSFNGKKRC